MHIYNAGKNIKIQKFALACYANDAKGAVYFLEGCPKGLSLSGRSRLISSLDYLHHVARMFGRCHATFPVTNPVNELHDVSKYVLFADSAVDPFNVWQDPFVSAKAWLCAAIRVQLLQSHSLNNRNTRHSA